MAQINRNALAGSATREHTGTKAKVYTSFASQVDVIADSPSTNSPARGFIVTDLGTGSTVEIVDAGGVTATITATALVGAFVPVGVQAFTTNTDVAEIVAIY